MCGLIGVSCFKDKVYDPYKLKLLMIYNQDRGTDSSGLWTPNNGLIKEAGKVAVKMLPTLSLIPDSIFIGHTRAATTGAKTKENAHPFEEGNLVFAHNGKIDNVWEICRDEKDDNIQYSKINVDSEIIGKLFAKYKKAKTVIPMLSGVANILAVNKETPSNLYVYKHKERPLFRGKSEEGIYISSVREGLEAIGCSNIKEFVDDYFYTIQNGHVQMNPIHVKMKVYNSSAYAYNDAESIEEYYERHYGVSSASSSHTIGVTKRQPELFSEHNKQETISPMTPPAISTISDSGSTPASKQLDLKQKYPSRCWLEYSGQDVIQYIGGNMKKLWIKGTFYFVNKGLDQLPGDKILVCNEAGNYEQMSVTKFNCHIPISNWEDAVIARDFKDFVTGELYFSKGEYVLITYQDIDTCIVTRIIDIQQAYNKDEKSNIIYRYRVPREYVRSTNQEEAGWLYMTFDWLYDNIDSYHKDMHTSDISKRNVKIIFNDLVANAIVHDKGTQVKLSSGAGMEFWVVSNYYLFSDKLYLLPKLHNEDKIPSTIKPQQIFTVDNSKANMYVSFSSEDKSGSNTHVIHTEDGEKIHVEIVEEDEVLEDRDDGSSSASAEYENIMRTMIKANDESLALIYTPSGKKKVQDLFNKLFIEVSDFIELRIPELKTKTSNTTSKV